MADHYDKFSIVGIAK